MFYSLKTSHHKAWNKDAYTHTCSRALWILTVVFSPSMWIVTEAVCKEFAGCSTTPDHTIQYASGQDATPLLHFCKAPWSSEEESSLLQQMTLMIVVWRLKRLFPGLTFAICVWPSCALCTFMSPCSSMFQVRATLTKMQFTDKADRCEQRFQACMILHI